MGDIADMILEGSLCASCGVYIDDDYPGHPRDCEGCKAEIKEEEKEKWH